MATFNDSMNKVSISKGSKCFQKCRKLVLFLYIFLTRASSLICNTNFPTYRINRCLSYFLSKAKKKVLKASLRKSPFKQICNAFTKSQQQPVQRCALWLMGKGRPPVPLDFWGVEGQAHASSSAPSGFREELKYLLKGWSRATDLDSERD